MRIFRVLLVCALLAGCGGGDEQSSATPSPQNEQDAVRQVFDGYMAAMKANEFDTACGHLAPETTAKLQENVKKLGVSDPPEECPEILALIQETANKQPEGKKLLDELYSTAKVKGITVTGNDSAIINWSAKVQGAETPISQSARKIDGEWKLVDVTN